jgi:hypothetical protein
LDCGTQAYPGSTPKQIHNPIRVASPTVGLHKRPTLRGFPPVPPNANAVAPTNPNGIASPSPGLDCGTQAYPGSTPKQIHNPIRVASPSPGLDCGTQAYPGSPAPNKSLNLTTTILFTCRTNPDNVRLGIPTPSVIRPPQHDTPPSTRPRQT